MLVLSRKLRESVMVGTSDTGQPQCKITVLEIKGGRVRLGFDVTREVPVHRFELWERLQASECLPLLTPNADLPSAD